MKPRWNRREVLRLSAAALSATAVPSRARGEGPDSPKTIAAAVTEYRKNSHADVILGKILEGWKQDGGAGPNLKLASLYVDQFPESDLARSMAEKHGVPIYDSIEDAMTLKRGKVAVDGVLSIGEHGNYPWNEKGQQLYPRQRFFREISDTFQKYESVVPVFNDKHLGPPWNEAQWIYQRAKQLDIPLMAGSSLPVTFREPDGTVPMGCDIENVVGIGYGGLDAYGFHALEFLQCLVERRRGAETGIESVQCLVGEAMWKALDERVVSATLFDAAWSAAAKAEGKNVRDLRGEHVALFLLRYNDGLQAALFMLSGVAQGHSVALNLKGQGGPVVICPEERYVPAFPHFAYLLKAIEQMIFTGRPSYPVERTLLTTGTLDRLLTSRFHQGRKLITPELAIAYEPVDFPYAPHIDLDARFS